MQPLTQGADNEQIIEEYNRAYHLNLFEKLCRKMKDEPSFKLTVLTLLRQSCNTTETIKAIWQREFGLILSQIYAEQARLWLRAYFKKKPNRQNVPEFVKQDLYSLQCGRCRICNKELGSNWKYIHVDHYIPWALVGDELENNLQLLCSSCNEKKNNKTKYVFENMIGLN